METNIWFYTFSTSAQVMATLAGLFAVFAVYKIQDFSYLLSQTRQAVIDILAYCGANTEGFLYAIRVQDAVSMRDQEILKRFLNLVELKEAEPNRVAVQKSVMVGVVNLQLDKHTYQFYSKLVDKRDIIFRKLRLILFLSIVAIAISLIALVGTSLLITCKYFIYASLLFFLFCLLKIAQEIYKVTAL